MAFRNKHLLLLTANPQSACEIFLRDMSEIPPHVKSDTSERKNHSEIEISNSQEIICGKEDVYRHQDAARARRLEHIRQQRKIKKQTLTSISTFANTT
ncbi:hypothetical protein K1719_039639 [Acacia pycnantha]|nr:hypothetical protein K1719_039639 [Acacia pycnantha]